jgi:hypothetical protein
MPDQITRHLAIDAGTMGAALEHISDELHTALLQLDALDTHGWRETGAQRSERVRAVTSRLDRLGAYVTDVRARTQPVASR